ncbi:MAG TPA: DegT/DnrJ/EryC1/StrS family aminotransferase, partial [Blastocatellia bacterium]|nr:DegT/DnrJ/EryC1/StrS family aminotransferase [Blastocatellia bacterium]
MNVPLLDLSRQYEKIAEELNTAVASVLKSQQFILGPEVKALEREVASYCGATYAIGCASGSDALLLALMALEAGPCDEVITTPYSFFATVGSIVRLGARPVFVDIDPKTFNIDVAQIEDRITANTKAILPIHLFGQCAEMDQINALASSRGIPVIEDAAQAIGAGWGSRKAGSLGTIGAFSFYPTKNLGGAGDGGLLTTSDPELEAKLRALRAHGARKKYFHDMVGVNSRLDSLQAAILRVKFKYLDEWAESRRANARRYRELFGETPVEVNGSIVLPEELGEGHHVYNQFVIMAKQRDELQSFLKQQGIGTEIYYPLPLHLQECFEKLGYKRGDFPASERAARESLAIPIYPELTSDEQEFVVQAIASFYKDR